jgi:hypothetical protein
MVGGKRDELEEVRRARTPSVQTITHPRWRRKGWRMEE